MSVHDPLLRADRPAILRWFGLGPPDSPDRDSSVPAPAADNLDPVRATRLSLLEDVTRFIDMHQLDVSALTLAAVHDYLTGSDLGLVRAIDRHIQAQLPITADWLETASAEDGRVDEREALSALMVRLETNLDEFGRTTHAARSAASDYSTALEAHVDGLGINAGTVSVISELATLARAMLTRTRDLEREMNRATEARRTTGTAPSPLFAGAWLG